MSKERELKKSGAYLKKIAAGKGAISGAFYFATNPSGSDSMVVIRVVESEDEMGDVTRVGKKFRAKISGAKFASGLIIGTPGKVTFEIYAGNVQINLMKTAFREHLYKSPSMALLKKAALKKAGAAVAQEDQGEAVTAKDIEGISDEEIQEIAGRQKEIANLNLRMVNLIEADAANEYQQQVSVAKQKLVEMEANVVSNPSDEAYKELHDARVVFAEKVSVGPDLFQGQSIDEQIILTVQVAATAAIESIVDSFTKATNEINEAAEILIATETSQKPAKVRELTPRVLRLREESLKYEAALRRLYDQVPVPAGY